MGHVVHSLLHRKRGATAEASPLRSRQAFTLLEMIGVMAILGILATALVPNAIRAIDRAAVKVEKNTLSILGHSLRSYLIENAALPTSSTWAAALATYTDKNAAAVASNSRGIARTFIYDPASSPAERALILSSMREGLPLPTASQINTAARFQALWDTSDGEIPSPASWPSWSSWNAVDGSEDFLGIERVNLRSIYLDELKTCSVALNNTTNASASYDIYDSSGARIANSVIGAGASVMLNNLSKGDRVHIYSTASYSPLVYSYIAIGVDRSFDLSDWIASGGTGNAAGSGENSGGSGGNEGAGNGNQGNGQQGNNGNGKAQGSGNG